MKDKEKDKKYIEIWGDTVDLKELVYASIIGVVMTMTMFLIGRRTFLNMDNIDLGLANGYSLLFGVLGCILSGIISAKLFKPKRIIEERHNKEDILDIISAAGMTLEEEIEALSNLDPEIIEELEELELYGLLSLIPEDSKNYKQEYKLREDI
ncbi:MAG: MFS transporter [Tissierellia bacterium]|nr:MFS transporter [Tissierellia bacterium]